MKMFYIVDMLYLSIYIDTYTCIYIYIYIHIYIYSITYILHGVLILSLVRGLLSHPATWKHGWSKHGSSIVPSKHYATGFISSIFEFNESCYVEPRLLQPYLSKYCKLWFSINSYLNKVIVCSNHVFTSPAHGPPWRAAGLANDISIYIYIYIYIYIHIHTYM